MLRLWPDADGCELDESQDGSKRGRCVGERPMEVEQLAPHLR